MKKLKRGKMKKTAMPSAMGMMEPQPVSIHLHAQGPHLKAAHEDLARQLKPLGFTKKKAKLPGKKMSISDALSS